MAEEKSRYNDMNITLQYMKWTLALASHGLSSYHSNSLILLYAVHTPSISPWAKTLFKMDANRP